MKLRNSRKWQLSAIKGIHIGRFDNIMKTISHKPMRLFKMLDATMRKAPCDYSKSSMRLFEKLHATTRSSNKK